jgi:hypothetical protein
LELLDQADQAGPLPMRGDIERLAQIPEGAGVVLSLVRCKRREKIARGARRIELSGVQRFGHRFGRSPVRELPHRQKFECLGAVRQEPHLVRERVDFGRYLGAALLENREQKA